MNIVGCASAVWDESTVWAEPGPPHRVSAVISGSVIVSPGASAPSAGYSSASFVDFERARNWRKVREQIKAIKKLERDWDDADAKPIAETVVAEALRFIDALREIEEVPPSRTVPSPDGSIVFEWHLPEGYFEAEVAGSGEIESMFQERGKPAEHHKIRIAPLSQAGGRVAWSIASEPAEIFESGFEHSVEGSQAAGVPSRV